MIDAEARAPDRSRASQIGLASLAIGVAVGLVARAAAVTVEHAGTSAADVAKQLEDVAAALRSHNIEAIVVETGTEARDVVLGLIPDGAEVHSGKSKTLEDIGLYAEIVESGRYDALRPRLMAMDRATQGAEMRKLVAAPDFMLGSVAAITADGTLVAASATGSQLGAYVSGAGRVILVVGSQKLVPDLDAAMRRIREVVFPWENDRVRERLGVDTSAREGPPHPRRVAAGAHHGRARPRAGRRLKGNEEWTPTSCSGSARSCWHGGLRFDQAAGRTPAPSRSTPI